MSSDVSSAKTVTGSLAAKQALTMPPESIQYAGRLMLIMCFALTINLRAHLRLMSSSAASPVVVLHKATWEEGR